MIRRAAFVTFVLFDVAIALIVAGIVIRYLIDQSGYDYHRGSRWSLSDAMILAIELAISLIPSAIALFGVLTTVWVFGQRRKQRIFPATRWTLFFNTHGMLVILAWHLLHRFHGVANDGTGYWLFLMVCLLYGVPLLIAALIIGGIADILLSVRRRRRTDVAVR